MKRIFTQIFLCLLFVGLSFSTLTAQAIFGLHGTFQPRTGAIASSDYRNSFGINFEVLSPDIKQSSPVSLRLGGQLSMMHAGEESVNALISPSQGVEGELTISNMQIGIHGIARISPKDTKWIVPYADFIAGMGIYGIEEMADDHEFDDAACEMVNTQVNPEVGVAAGLMIPLGRRILFDVRGTYLNTGKIPFANLNTVRVNEGIVDYQIDNIRPALFNLKVGITMAIDGSCW